MVYRNYIKRLMDIVLSLILLLPLVTLTCIIFLFLKLEDGGPVFYASDRLGLNGKRFKILKFRSMMVNAPDIRNDDGSTFNSENDVRVTKVGKFLRKTSIDEIPQVFNVLIGQMSFIGPRPDLPEAIDVYTKKQLDKLKVRPGITGYSQAFYRNTIAADEKFNNDVFYVDHISFKLDLNIFIHTISSVLKKKGIYNVKG